MAQDLGLTGIAMKDGFVALCGSGDLQEAHLAVPFDLRYAGQTCRAFAIRFQGVAHAYLNRCTHVAMEMDWQPIAFLMIRGSGCCVPHMARPMHQTVALAPVAHAKVD
jgi:nitrite reductase/ring-hydroxylating ferredoxin subunit